jgi:metal-sulfur cluster biosynthetic enzyme
MTGRFDAQVKVALEGVVDPCSVASGAPLSVLDMGLVLGWEVDENDDLVVRIDTTSPGCLMAAHIVADGERRLRQITGLRSATVVVQPSGEWTSERITGHGHEVLRARRTLALLRQLGPEEPGREGVSGVRSA